MAVLFQKSWLQLYSCIHNSTYICNCIRVRSCVRICSHNELSSLPAALVSLTDLHLLKLDHNKLTVLPADLGTLVHLEELDVSHNLLSSLPPSLGGLKALHVLTATDNHLETLPQSVGSLTGKIQITVTARYQNPPLKIVGGDFMLLYVLSTNKHV